MGPVISANIKLVMDMLKTIQSPLSLILANFSVTAMMALFPTILARITIPMKKEKAAVRPTCEGSSSVLEELSILSSIVASNDADVNLRQS